MDNVYLLITDLHLRNGNFESRYDYKRETDHVISEIAKLATKHKNSGDNVIGIYLGDIYDRSYSDVFEAVSGNNQIISLRMMMDDCYSVVGNHEFTYYKSNPFWTLFTKIESDSIKKLVNKVWQPQGVFDILSIPDVIEDGEVKIWFNHYGVPIHRPRVDGTVNIGLFHQDVYLKQIVEDMEASKGLSVFEHDPVYFDKNQALRGYDYAFFAHMHKLYWRGKYIDDNTGQEIYLQYLASLGRTNHTEVQNNFLERNIPAIRVRDGKFIGVENNLFNLLPREECVNETLVQKRQEQRQIALEKKEFATYIPRVDDPIENIKLSLVGQEGFINLVDELIDKDVTKIEIELLKMLEEVKWG